MKRSCQTFSTSRLCRHMGTTVGLRFEGMDALLFNNDRRGISQQLPAQAAAAAISSRRRSITKVSSNPFPTTPVPTIAMTPSVGKWLRPYSRAFMSSLSKIASTSHDGNGSEESCAQSSSHDEQSLLAEILSSLSPQEALKRLEQVFHHQQHQRDNTTVSFPQQQKQQRLLLNVIATSGNIHQMEQVTRNFSWWHDAESMEILIRGWIRFQRETTTDEAGGAILLAQLLHEWTSLAKTASSLSSSTTTTTTATIVYPSLKILRTVLMALADRGEYEMAIRLLEQRLQQDSAEVGILPGKGSFDRDCFHRVLHACCNAGALDQAWKVVEMMKNGHNSPSPLVTGISPNRSTYKILLQTHVNHHSIHKTRGTGLKAYRVFQEMEQPDQVSYNITLNALAQEGYYEQAEELFFQLLESIDNKESMDDPIPLRTVLKACGEANSHKAANRAESLVKTLQSLPCVDARAYSTVVAMWCKLGQPERAKRLLAELTSMYLGSTPPQSQTNNNPHRWKPDPISFRTVIGTFSQKIESIMGPSNINYYGKKHWNEAKILAASTQEVFMDMYTIMKYDPNLITCNAILKCWCQARQPEVAEDFLQQMLQWDMSPDIVSYNTIIACYGKLGNVDACTAWLSKMAQPESPFPSPNTRTVTAVITALSKRGTKDAAEQAEAWFMHMQEWHLDWGWDCSPNQVTLNALLGCWARIGNGHRAESILRQFQSYHRNCNLNNSNNNHAVSPDIVSYNTVIHAYRNDMIKIQCLLQDLIAAGLQPNQRTVELVRTAMEQDPSIQDKTLKWYELKQRYFYFPSTTAGSNGNSTKAKKSKS